MVKPSEVLALAASDMNDTGRQVYTDEALLPYLNMAAIELLNRLQDNGTPIVYQRSHNIKVTKGISQLAIADSNQIVNDPLGPYWLDQLPQNMVDLLECWEASEGYPSARDWTPMRRVDKINPNLEFSDVQIFGVYDWGGYYMRVPRANADRWLRIDYLVKTVPAGITIDQIDIPWYTDAILFLSHRTASLAAALVAQDETRASALNDLAEKAAEREINIPTKGNQQIATRRRPFRASYKMRGYSW